MNYIVVDIDGTLADDSHRIQHWQGHEGADEYFKRISEDKPNQDVKWLLHNADMDGAYIILVTCRPEKHREKTEEWLLKYSIPHCALIMRADHDKTPSEVLKIEHLERYFGTKENVLKSVMFVLEDRDKVVNALREYGLNVWQVRKGSY